MKNKTLITGLLLGIVVVLLGVVIMGSKTKQSNISKKTIIFFYGNTCPHCAEVEAWLQENKIAEKMSIVKKEVYDNQQNAQAMIHAAKSCGLPTESIGVPFLYAEGKCFIGTPDVVHYLSGKAGIVIASDSAERSVQ